MSQLFIAQQLDQLLQYWEDCNLSGEFNFQLNLITKNVKSEDVDLAALTGSELSRLGLFARAIPEYQNLRKVLMGYPIVQQNNFLPRIPKDMRDIFNGDYGLFLDHNFVKSPVHIPQFLLNWNETKRACIVDDSLPVPVIDLRQENWISKLPYSSFFLKLTSPFIFTDSSDKKEEWSLDSFLIYNDQDYVRIMAWPKETDRFVLTDNERKLIRTGIQTLKSKKVPKKEASIAASKVTDWFLANLAVLKGTSQIRTVQGIDKSVLHSDIYDESAFHNAGQTLIDLNLRLRVMLETINGFCKLMATLPPKPEVHSIESSSVKNQPMSSREWFELPLQTVEYFHTSREEEVIVIKRGSGGEKSPHIRRAHTRRIVRSNGTIEEIWIEQATIRADKLVTEQLQSGAIKIQ